MIASTIALSGPSSAIPSTNDLSIFNKSTGKRLRYERLEKPVPKSSIASETPRVLSFVRISMVVSAPSMATDSVISRITLAGLIPVFFRTSETSSISVAC